MMKLVQPDKKHIKSILNEYREQYFYETDGALGLVFKNYPKNKNIHQILTKVVMINQLYGTNIFDPLTVAKHIYDLRAFLDNELYKGSLSIVDKIEAVKFGHKTRYFYSFATKYCSWHRPEQYFIYDSFVDMLLWEYKKKYNFYDYKRSDVYEYGYEKFHNICLNFKSFFGLNWITNKKLDEFLWLEAKRISGNL